MKKQCKDCIYFKRVSTANSKETGESTEAFKGCLFH